MTWYFWYLAAFSIVAAWWITIRLLQRKGSITEDGAWGSYGPFLMWKTQKGKSYLDKLAEKKKFFETYGNASLIICLIGMLGISALLLWQVTLVFDIPAENAPDPVMMVGIPGLNPIIPLWYGILALVVALVIHEGAHGIMSRLSKIPVKSVGLVFMIFPMGAFVEPDEDAIKKAPRKARIWVYAAGPASNIILAVVLILVFSFVFAGAMVPVDEGVGITQVSAGTPADGNLSAGMILTSINGTAFTNKTGFSDALQDIKAGDTVEVTVSSGDSYMITMADRYNYTKVEDDMGKGYLGVSSINIDSNNPYDMFSDADSPGGLVQGGLIFMSLPLLGLSPIKSPITDFYTINGAMSVIPAGLFWVLFNAIYWVAWLNLAVGLTNVLPAVPLDGGYLFYDGASHLLEKFSKKKLTEEKKEEIIGHITAIFSVAILFLILAPVIVPRLI